MRATAAPVRVARVCFGLLALVALLRQLAIHLALGFNPVNFFSYYTVLANLFTGCLLLLLALRPAGRARFVETLRVISVVNMALVGIVFSTLLRDTDLGSMLAWVNFVIPARVVLGRRELALCLVFPLAYLVYTLLRGPFVGFVGALLIAVGNRRRTHGGRDAV